MSKDEYINKLEQSLVEANANYWKLARYCWILAGVCLVLIVAINVL